MLFIFHCQNHTRESYYILYSYTYIYCYYRLSIIILLNIAINTMTGLGLIKTPLKRDINQYVYIGTYY